MKTVYVNRGILNAALFAGTIVLQCLTTNILEAFALLIMLFVCYNTLIKASNFFQEFVLGSTES